VGYDNDGEGGFDTANNSSSHRRRARLHSLLFREVDNATGCELLEGDKEGVEGMALATRVAR